ncbi:ribosome small subunit-dependent GTPase A [Desulfotalea psychrophila]|uniref:Small ribosomal subunit biogenesis GTPase RsgA n=1 Tax=Desulfotalea psychrophila (strain LSv54 / DSM 12343) TaxID=177439 RepID=Q6ANG3_DESPS|nr:ribosome small subunit-dependent GTPase A [Desulfotalea psychrophila]CAG36111.1 conserved hypothetical protein [Desulfotalea psychrophila LSv54]
MSEDALLSELGWSAYWQNLFDSHTGENIPARVIRGDRGSMLVATTNGVLRAKPSARFLKANKGTTKLPVVGDWLVAFPSDTPNVLLFEAVLKRKSLITRGSAGKTSGAQALAANIDTVFIVHPIAEEPNLRRMERELSVAWDSGATPVVLLTKADLAADPDATLEMVKSVAMGVKIALVNSKTAEAAELLRSYITGYLTAVLIGPSGAGKSTLVNSLAGTERQATGAVREGDGKGRHTTVARELIQISGHGIIIDTPGIRAIGLTGSTEGISQVFPDIEELSHSCRFRDCSHTEETGCAVTAAAESGQLSLERLASYLKLVQEVQEAAQKEEAQLRAIEKRKGHATAKGSKKRIKRG